MSWIQRLYETYENNCMLAIEGNQGEVSLIPSYHIIMQTHIEVTIDGDGNFLRARLCDSKESKIIIPASEKSAGRSGSQPTPHPLIDKIQYLAGDYTTYGGEKFHGYPDYCNELEKWSNSEYTTPQIKAISNYVKKGHLIKDLVDYHLITLDDNQKALGKWSKEENSASPNINMLDSVVRWCVEIYGNLESRVWADEGVINSWIGYVNSREGVKEFCQVKGEKASLCMNHPKNIYNMCANAKLISSNDDQGFTYRGRFTTSQQAYGVSNEVSQKAHNALKWLISKQGYNKKTKSIILWSVKGNEVINLFEDTSGLYDEDELALNFQLTGYSGEDLAHTLKQKLQGYDQTMDSNNRIILMAVESVTDGRLSITYYQELDSSDFIERVDKWHNTCKWSHNYRFIKKLHEGDKEPKVIRIPFIGAPSPIDIAKTVYGNSKSVDDDLLMSLVNRILACIVDNRKIPLDIVRMAIHRTIRREVFEEAWQFDKALSITCALYHKYLIDYKEEDVGMSLDKERKNRDYLYGRLLAVAQNIEQWALDTEDTKRLTNADRLMHRFADHPYSTWRTIELSLKPYLDKLQGKGRGRERLIDEIMGLFQPEEFAKDSKLSGEFLLGYHHQREALRAKMNESQIQEYEASNDLSEGGNEYVK